MTERVLDWAPRHDPRSRNFPARGVTRGAVTLRHKVWRLGPVLDQGQEGACVGFGWTGEALSTPVAVDLRRVKKTPGNIIVTTPDAFARQVYKDAQKIDEWAGEDYEGTSVLAGVKAMKLYGLVKEYRWCFGITDVRDAVLSLGPVVIGIWWYAGMYDAPNGELVPSGERVGGHCLIVAGYSPAGKVFNEPGYLLRNSWGKDWGVNGSAWIRESHLAALLNDDGEAAVATRRSYGR